MVDVAHDHWPRSEQSTTVRVGEGGLCGGGRGCRWPPRRRGTTGLHAAGQRLRSRRGTNAAAGCLDGWLADGPLSVEELARRAVEAGLVADGVDDEGMEPEDHIDAIIERSDDYWDDRRPS